MNTLEIFLLIVIAINLINFFYILFKKPFWNFFKQALWYIWDVLCLIALYAISIIYAISTEKLNRFLIIAIFIAILMEYISSRIIEKKFCTVMYGKTHFFRITSFVGKKIYGELAIIGTKEVIPARLVCPLHADYKNNNIIPVTVLFCKLSEIVVEPTEN